MKKLLLPLVLILLLCSCNTKAPKNERPDFNINSRVSIEYMQGNLTADVATASDGTVTMVINSPENLRGITVECGTEEIAVRYGELKLQCTDGYFPLTELYKTVSFAKNSVPDVINAEGEKYIFEYSNGNDKYVFTTDNQKNTIQRIETPLCVYTIKR